MAKRRVSTRPARARGARPALDDDATRQRIWATVDSIPRGRVATYGDVAREAGLPGRARLVGCALRELPSGTKLAWHRVINAAGRISLPAGEGAALQRRRLSREGVRVDASGRLDLARFRWKSG